VGSSVGVISQWADIFKRRRTPTTQELIDYYTGVVFTCSSLNASTCARVSLTLYARSQPNGIQTRHLHRRVEMAERDWLKRSGVCKGLNATSGMVEVLDHPVLSLLENVNHLIDGFSLAELTHLYQEVTGLAYWLVESGAFGRPERLWIIPPQFLFPKFNDNRELAKYEFRVRGQTQDIPVDMVIPFRFPSLTDPNYEGCSPTKALVETIDNVRADDAFQTAFINNRARPELWITPKQQGMGKHESRRLKAQLLEAFSTHNAGGTIITESAMDVKELTRSSRDMEGLARRKVSRDEVCNAFGVPLPLMNERTNLANLKAALIQHATLAVIPRMTRYCQTLTQQLLPRYDQSGSFFFGFTNPIPEDEKAKAEVRSIRLKSGEISINEARAETGKAEVAWGKKAWLPATLSQPSDDDAANSRQKTPPPSTGTGGPAGRPPEKPSEFPDRKKSLPDPEQVYDATAMYWAGVADDHTTVKRLVHLGMTLEQSLSVTQHSREPLELVHCHEKAEGHGRPLPLGSDLADVLRGVFREQRTETLKSFKLEWSKAAWDDIDLSKWDPILAKRATPAIQLAMANGMKEVVARLGLVDGPQFSIFQPEAKTAVKRAVLRLSAETNRTTERALRGQIKELRQSLAEALGTDANTPALLTKAVGRVFKDAETWRAKRIALTESSRATHTGQALAAKNSGVVIGFKWLLSDDACDLCQAILKRHPNGIKLEETFGDVDSYAARGDAKKSAAYNEIPHPPAHPNCRCALLETIDESKL
jgi:HK97 family phage portal protein